MSLVYDEFLSPGRAIRLFILTGEFAGNGIQNLGRNQTEGSHWKFLACITVFPQTRGSGMYPLKSISYLFMLFFLGSTLSESLSCRENPIMHRC